MFDSHFPDTEVGERPPSPTPTHRPATSQAAAQALPVVLPARHGVRMHMPREGALLRLLLLRLDHGLLAVLAARHGIRVHMPREGRAPFIGLVLLLLLEPAAAEVAVLRAAHLELLARDLCGRLVWVGVDVRVS